MTYCRNCGLRCPGSFCSSDCEAEYYYSTEPIDDPDLYRKDREFEWSLDAG